jgi:hypothetical protein
VDRIIGGIVKIDHRTSPANQDFLFDKKVSAKSEDNALRRKTH